VSRSFYIKNHMSRLHEIFCMYYLLPWVGPSLMTMQYVMYFQLCR